LENSIQKT